MVSFIVFAMVLVLMTLGMPIAISLALATTIGMLVGGYDGLFRSRCVPR